MSVLRSGVTLEAASMMSDWRFWLWMACCYVFAVALGKAMDG
jgi:hypothetical protein